MKERISNHCVLLLISIACTIIFFNSISLSGNNKSPNFVLYTVRGERYIFYDIIKALPSNGLVLLNFTSVYCKPCRKEIPELLAITKNSKRLKLLCVYSETGKAVEESADELGVVEKAYVDPFGSIRSKFNVKKIPVTFLIDKRYNIIKRFEGYTEKNIKDIEILTEGE